MKRIKISFAVILASLAFSSISAQLQTGIHYYLLGDYQRAKGCLVKELTANPVEANFYLGEIAFKEGDAQKAKEYYDKGLSADPENIQNQVGLAKLNLKADTKNTETFFKALQKKNKKNIDVPLTIGRAYLDNGMLKQADNMVSDAKKINSKNPDIYILEGDVLLAVDSIKKIGDAAGKFEMSTYFDPNFAFGYVKTAQVYEIINSKLAIDKLKTIIEKQPDYMIAYGLLGKIYVRNGFYPQAIELYTTYLKSGVQNVWDIERYARALYFTEDYAAAEKVVLEGLKTSPKHFVLNRYQMYINAKTKNIDEGLLNAEEFFSLREPSRYIAQDRTMYATLLKDAKRFTAAIAEIDKAMVLEPDNMDLYTEAISIAREKRDFAVAATYLQKQMNKKAAVANSAEYEDDIVDVNTLGFNYYNAGTSLGRNVPLAEEFMADKKITDKLFAVGKNLYADSLTTDLKYFTRQYSLYYLNKADSTFNILIERAPEGYSGYRLKALTQHAINPNTETGLARPYYEKVVEILLERDEQTDANKRILLEAYIYLGYHHYLNSDKANSILYMNKVLELDSENKTAKLILDDVNKPQ